MKILAKTISAHSGNLPPGPYQVDMGRAQVFHPSKTRTHMPFTRCEVLEALKENNINMSEVIKDGNVVFKTKVTERLALHPNTWPGDASAEVIRAIITNFKDSKGEAITLTPVEVDAISIACRPQFDVQVRLIKRILESRGVRADADTEKNILRVTSATKFTKELQKLGLIKEAGDSDLKDLLG